MKLLLDECIDWRFLRDLSRFDAKTVRQMGWTGTANGALLELAEQEFDVFITVDKNLSLQQNVSHYDIAVIVLRGRTTRLPDLRSLVPAVIAVLPTLQPGEVRVITQ